MSSVTVNLARIRASIAAAASSCGRDPGSVELVAVSKVQTPEKIEEALRAGQRVFGENRVQEAMERWGPLRPLWPEIRLHLIGPLQTNKAADAVRLFDCVETVDRPKLVHVLAREMARQKRFLPCFVQVNTGDEAQKGGIAPAALPDLLACCAGAGLRIEGLMCIPPRHDPPALHFALLAKLALRHGLPSLSMGMSADYERAVAAGATHVRVGSALFGERRAEIQ